MPIRHKMFTIPYPKQDNQSVCTYFQVHLQGYTPCSRTYLQTLLYTYSILDVGFGWVTFNPKGPEGRLNCLRFADLVPPNFPDLCAASSQISHANIPHNKDPSQLLNRVQTYSNYFWLVYYRGSGSVLFPPRVGRLQGILAIQRVSEILQNINKLTTK